ncbi:deoxyribodipyrimidine photo-lyase/cryptochrome family protein [Mucisphaera sp.]|uniref:cryptochrome/deoxyribodipyrimidine photo-lyase family protein n=1 Tax=Mucisphaera sp. TaxID=2913024 RepID=UPI003D0EA5A6
MSVVWFKRDLRVVDHEPLVRAAEAGPVIGLYVYEPEVIDAAEHDGCHLRFVNQSLAELREALRGLGGELILARGEVTGVLDRLREAVAFDGLWSHEETGLGATYERDKRVKAWAKRRGVRWVELPQHGVVRVLKTRDGWAKKWLKRMAVAPFAKPTRIEPWPAEAMGGIAVGEILDEASLGVEASTKTEAQPGGREVGLDLLGSFLTERGRDYQRAMSSPVEGEWACSQMSPHLAYGTVSLREAHHAAQGRLLELKGKRGEATEWRRSVNSFAKRLRWQSHFIQKLEDEPAIEFRNMHRAYDGLREEDLRQWTDRDHQRFEAWCAGRTGYPMVDACMRCLHRTGWINFRVRAMLMSFASYHLWLHWRHTAPFLARQFLDFEPGIHYSQCQMQSGTTGINTVRIYSPIKQALDQDPEGVFIRRWVPELERMPVEYLSQPERCPEMTQAMAGCVVGEDYPGPVVDHKEAYREAQRRMFAVRGSAAARRESKRVYLKHGSRKRPGDRRMPSGDDRGGATEQVDVA